MVYVGIDVAKRSHVLSAVGADGETVVESFKFANTEGGFKKLADRLAKAGIEPAASLFCMEATGHYWVALFDFLSSRGFDAAVVNPIQTDAFRDVWTIRKVKTDALDAAMIADLARYKRYEPSALGDEAADELRTLARYRMSLVERSTMLKNRATAVLDRVFPELDGLFSGSFGAAQRALLRHAATPRQVISTDVRTLARILSEASNGRLGRAKAEQLKAAARASVGVGFGSETLAFELRMLMEELDLVRGQIDEVEAELARLLDATAGKVAAHRGRHRPGARRHDSRRDRRREPLRRPRPAHGLRGDGPHEERVRRDRGLGRLHVQARLGRASLGAHAGRGLRPQVRSVLRRLLRQEEGRGEAPLRGAFVRRPQAHGSVPGPHEGGQALRAGTARTP